MRVGLRLNGLSFKIIAWSFVPTAIILTIVALVGFYAYQQVTQDLTIQSSRELARLSAGQLSAQLSDYSSTLTTLARTASMYEQNPSEQRAALTQASSRLMIFDGGLVLLDNYGKVIAAQPPRPEIVGEDWSSRDYFRQMIRSPGTVFSNIVKDGPGGTSVIVIAVPITNARGEFVGTLAGMFRVGAPVLNLLYGSIVRLRVGTNENAYLVDGDGIVIYHTNEDWIGRNLGTQPMVQQLGAGKADALRTRDPAGREIVASFAPVPGTPWELVREENWDALLAPGQRYIQFLIFLLVLGLVVPAVVVMVGVQRITEPINRLIVATQAVAAGNLGQTTTVQTGDEIEELSMQFNRMSAQLEESYSELEQRVAARTKELATVNSIAAMVSGSLNLKEILNAALTKSIETMRMEAGTAYYIPYGDEPDEEKYLVPAARRGLSNEFSQFVGSPPVRGSVVEIAARAQKPVAWLIHEHPDPRVKQALESEGVRQIISVPLFAKGKLVGAFNLATRHERTFAPEEMSLLSSIGQQVAVAVENARLYDRAEHAAALAERTRLARELHDSVTQSLYSVTMYAEAAQLLLKDGNTATAGEHLRELRDTAQEALREMRLLIYELRPVALEKRGLAAALQARLDAVETRGGLKSEFLVQGEERLPLAAQQELYHIAQEALNNVLKHSHAQHVRVHLVYADHTASLQICDDGAGFDPEKSRRGGLGLAGMKERVQRIGGKLEIASAIGKGTQIKVEILV